MQMEDGIKRENLNKRQQQKAATRERILQTAYRLYSERGFSVATKEIAAEAGVSHGTLFAHFPTVDALLEVLLEQFSSTVSTELHVLSEQNADLLTSLKCHVSVLARHEKFYGRLIEEKALLPEASRYLYVSIQTTLSFHLSRILQRYRDEGKVKELPDHLLFNSWLGLVHYYISNRDLFCSNGDSVLARFGGELAAFFTQLVLKE